MPHLAHMILAGVTIVLLAVMVMLMGMATCDLNPLNVSRLSSSDEVATIKMLLLKIIFVLVATALDTIGNIQPVIMAIAMWGVVYYMFDGVSRRNRDMWEQCWGWLVLILVCSGRPHHKHGPKMLAHAYSGCSWLAGTVLQRLQSLTAYLMPDVSKVPP